MRTGETDIGKKGDTGHDGWGSQQTENSDACLGTYSGTAPSGETDANRIEGMPREEHKRVRRHTEGAGEYVHSREPSHIRRTKGAAMIVEGPSRAQLEGHLKRLEALEPDEGDDREGLDRKREELKAINSNLWPVYIKLDSELSLMEEKFRSWGENLRVLERQVQGMSSSDRQSRLKEKEYA